MKTWHKIIIGVIVLLALILAINYSGIGEYCSLATIQQHSEWLCVLIREYYPIATIFFIVLYAACIALSIPSTGPLSIAAGYFFGFFGGVVFSMIGALIGASISFYFLKKMAGRIKEQQNEQRVSKLKSQLDRFGHFYLLILHFTIVVPFIIINTLAVIAGISWSTFLWVTTIGIIPGILLYVFAGQQLTEIHSIRDLFSWPVIFALLLLIIVTVLPMFLHQKDKKVDVK